MKADEVQTVKEKAGTRRERELRSLAREGMPIHFQGRWKATVGALHIWSYSGRWFNEKTAHSGRIHLLSMRALIERETGGDFHQR